MSSYRLYLVCVYMCVCVAGRLMTQPDLVVSVLSVNM